MKTIIFGLLLLGLAGPALAVDRVELDDRVRMLTGKFEALQAQPDKRMPADVLRKAQGIILLDTTKAGFMFAFQGVTVWPWSRTSGVTGARRLFLLPNGRQFRFPGWWPTEFPRHPADEPNTAHG